MNRPPSPEIRLAATDDEIRRCHHCRSDLRSTGLTHSILRQCSSLFQGLLKK